MSDVKNQLNPQTLFYRKEKIAIYHLNMNPYSKQTILLCIKLQRKEKNIV